MPRALLTLVATAALVVAGCGTDEDSPTTEIDEEPLATCEGSLTDVTVTGEPGAQPTVQFAPGLAVDQTQCQVLVEGEGEGAVEGDVVMLDFLFANGRTGQVYGSTYNLPDPPSIVVNDTTLRGVRTALLGAKDGSRIAVVMRPEDAHALSSGELPEGVERDDTIVFVADVDDVNPRAEGAAVAPVPGLPTVQLEEKGEPIITVPGGDPPTELVAQPLIEGTGPVIQPGQKVTIHYKGVIWASGQEFDSTWGSSPTRFAMGTDGLSALEKGLQGQKIGSQILLVVPPSEGYGAEGAPSAGIGPTDTLVFVVDILHTR